MSGVVKGVKKVFKKVAKVVKKIAKPLLIAAAVYFTAGVALSAFSATAGMAAAMPGFGAGGLFSKAAVAIGFKGAAGSGIAATAAASSASAAAAGAAAAGNFGAYGSIMSGGAAAGSGTVAAGTGALSSGALAASTAGAGTAAAAGAKGFFAGMSSFEKVMMLKMGVDTAAGLLAKKPDPFPAPNQFSGRDSKGNGPGLGVTFNRETGNIDMAADSGGGKSMAASGSAQASMETTGGSAPVQGPTEPGGKAAMPGQSDEFIASQNAAPQDLNAASATEQEQGEFISRGYKTGDYSGMA